MRNQKRISLDAKELLSDPELYEIKAGENDNFNGEIISESCGSSCMIFCTQCVACTTCKVWSRVFMQ